MGVSYLEDQSHSPPQEETAAAWITRVCSRGDLQGAPPCQVLPARALDRNMTAYSTEEDTEAQEETNDTQAHESSMGTDGTEPRSAGLSTQSSPPHRAATVSAWSCHARAGLTPDISAAPGRERGRERLSSGVRRPGFQAQHCPDLL